MPARASPRRTRTSARTSRGRAPTRAARSSTPTATASGIPARARPRRRRTSARTSRVRRRPRAARSSTPTATASTTPGQGLPADQEDKCPDEPGPKETQGCPIKDTDGDGLPDPGQGVTPEDKCPTEPETDNNYQDEDGCPDEIPKAVTKFTGAIRGINFDVDKDTIKKNSTKTLDAAVQVLKDFPDVRIEISGHTDSDGSADHNRDLSRRRAEAVKQYLVDKGIEGKRIETRGAGPDEPVADNKTARGKAQNRRIEFKLLKGGLESK
ncbi:MAG: OmpA family protein [Myxococcales bacterium]|nr:OmpA family protein [Myxococcales bacterium]